MRTYGYEEGVEGVILGSMATKRDGTRLNDLPPVVRESLLRCTPLQRRFVMAYCGMTPGNGQLAVKLAGGKGDYGSRAAQASQLVREEPVRAAIDAWWTTFAAGAAEVTSRIADLARSSLEPFLEVEPGAPGVKKGKGKKARKAVRATSGGGIKLRAQTDASWARHAHWIKRVEVDPKTGRVTDLQVHDPLKALDLHAKILKLYSDAPQVNLFLYLQSLSDDDLLGEYERAAREAGLGGPTASVN